jgi:deoxyribonuclease V
MIDFKKLKDEQTRLAEKVIINDALRKAKTMAGVDQAFSGDKVVSGIVVCNRDFEIIEKKYSVTDVKISYASGLLFYREGPGIMESYNKLDTKPEVLMVKGNGILHPRRIGMASQIGVLLDVPTIGIAKSLMLGEVRGRTIYVDKEARGYELVTRKYAKPIYISPGHKISLKTSMELIKNSIKYPHKLPEPLHLAHKYANSIKKNLINTS